MPKLLIVEDNPENSDSLSRRLQRRGFEVVAADGVKRVAASLAEKPDFILINVSIAEVNGWEATERVKAFPLTAHIPVVALTAHALIGDEGKSRATGCDAYLTKPLHFAALMSHIERLLPPPTTDLTATAGAADADAPAPPLP